MMGGFGGILGVVLVVTCGILGEPQEFLQANIPGRNPNQNTNGNNQQGGILNRQVGGLSFAIPGLSLLQGGNGGAGNFFGPATVTRTVVSTVSTVTTASYRTCTTSAANLPPCVSGPATGRRKRRDANPHSYIRQTPSMALIIGDTTLVDPYQVTQYLRDHQPSTQSVIYPPGVRYVEESSSLSRDQRAMQEDDSSATTILYPSQDTPDPTDSSSPSILLDGSEVEVTTQTSYRDDEEDVSTSNPPYNPEDVEEVELEEEKARVGLGRTTTVTTVIRVTSVATSLATGPSATLTIMYTGCMPPTLPVSGIPCGT